MMRPQDLYPRLIQDTYRTISDDRARRQVVFRWILKLLVLFLCITSAVSFLEGRPAVGILTLALAASYFGSYWIVYIWKNTGVIIVSILMTLEVVLVYGFLLHHGISDGFPIVWVLITPPIAIILMGREMGTISSLIIFAMMVFYLWTPIGQSMLGAGFAPIFKSRLPIIYLLLLLISALSETLRVVTVEQLRESRRRMESIYQQQYSSIHRRVEIAKKTRHDLRHHFVMINQYLEDGKIEEAKEYINRYYKALPFEEALMYCDHYGTNALLTYFSQRAANQDVEKTIQVHYPQELPIPDEDLTVVFGNLLENALDGCMECMQADPNCKPYFHVRGNFAGNMLTFSVRNSMVGEAKQDKHGVFLSTKHEGNGVGISSVKGIVEKHGGSMEIKQENGEFLVNVMMF